MTKVVKIGGALLEKPVDAVTVVRRFLTDRTVIVHGGGLQITRMLERMNVQSVFIDGLRVTDEKTLGGVAAALLGEVHTALIRELHNQGIAAIGVFGEVLASKKAGPWGLVGTNLRAQASALHSLLDLGRVPVIPTLAIGEDSVLNVNGDETAAAVAIALRSEELVFLTDVEGVKDGNGVVIDCCNKPDELIQAEFVTGGMIPKLRAVKTAMAGGVETVRVGRTLFGATS